LERIKKYLNELNIEFVPNQKLGEDVSIDQLLGEHNKVIICTGANVPNELNPEETPIKNSRGNKVTSLSGMYNSNKFLTRAKAGKLNNVSGQRVVIIGAGNVAMDAARTALQDLGAKSVRIIYRRAEKDMPATGEEVGKTKDDGATFEFLLSPHKIYEANKNGKIVKKIVFQKTEGTGDYDREGREKVRLVPKSVPNPYKRIEADIIVTALGSHVDTTGLKKMVNLKEEDKLTIDENGKSNIENVFFAGDDTGQTRTAISAMAWAKRTAQTVDEELAAEI
jgi:glutamate synthase (NADPH/NADH) small chain